MALTAKQKRDVKEHLRWRAIEKIAHWKAGVFRKSMELKAYFELMEQADPALGKASWRNGNAPTFVAQSVKKASVDYLRNVQGIDLTKLTAQEVEGILQSLEGSYVAIDTAKLYQMDPVLYWQLVKTYPTEKTQNAANVSVVLKEDCYKLAAQELDITEDELKVLKQKAKELGVDKD